MLNNKKLYPDHQGLSLDELEQFCSPPPNK